MTRYQLPELEYDYNELEPVIYADIMRVHHGKHHQGYVNNLNKALENFQEAQSRGDLAKMMVLQKAVHFNAGGHINHSLFWENLAPASRGGGGEPQGDLLLLIKNEFGSFEAFIEKFSALTVAVQGSGWGWLGYDKEKNRVDIMTCFNQDLLQEKGLIPLLCIDVWEHAYYLQYKNLRADFVKKIWDIINWKKVAERLGQAATGK